MRIAMQETNDGVRRKAAKAIWRKRVGLLCLILGVGTMSAAQNAQASTDAVTFKNLVSFDGTNGGNPRGRLVQGLDGNLYGTTGTTGANGGGTFFKMSPGGSLTVLYNFCAPPSCAGPSGPNWLVLGTDGNFYGTAGGGTHAGPFGGRAGTAFKITPAGKLTTLYNFCAMANCTDGADPQGFVLGADGNLYGTTNAGGNSMEQGTVFKLTPGGTLKTLYTFCSQANCTDGGSPAAAPIQGVDGNFYGTAQFGGANGGGTVFKITPTGALTTLYSFGAQPNAADGLYPIGSLVQTPNGNFYGTTSAGGAFGGPGGPGGVVFQLARTGVLTVLYSFCSQTNCTDGAEPYYGGLVLANDGNFYGTTAAGGTGTCIVFGLPGCGTVFKITSAGALSTLHDFGGITDGDWALGLVQATNGAFYGPTEYNGSGLYGTIFNVAVGLPPFVELLLTSGKIGATIQILGSNLTGATGVSFNGTAAMFTVVSATLIKATVPTGATTGFVMVTTPARTLKSNVEFQVRP